MTIEAAPDPQPLSGGEPGISRRRAGKGFSYHDASGAHITDRGVVDRIRQVAIPPAWREVWISADPGSALQATGIDARGRKQYRYHERFRASQDALKFGHLARFGKSLPRVRRRVARDLRAKGLPRERVLAALVRILDLTALRVGGEAYARENGTFGLTTLRRRHASVRGSTVMLAFRGKGKRRERVRVDDAAVAAVVRRCRAAGDRRLFGWRRSDGSWHTIRDADVNGYIRLATGARHSAKDFRTWAATVAAARMLTGGEPEEQSPGQLRGHSLLVAAVAVAADELGDTPAVTRRSYIHPGVIEALAAEQPARVRPHKRSGQRKGEALALALLGRRRGTVSVPPKA
jgi:DNA topoisomerase I